MANDMITYEEQMKKQMAALSTSTASVTDGKKISLKDKIFSFPDGTKQAGPVDMVIVDFIPRHMYYDTPYREDEYTPPACFAIGRDVKNMVPSENSRDKQSEDCKTCPMFEFGSNPNGRGGKACRETRLLAVVAPDAGSDDPVYLLETSVTAVKKFDAYVNTITAQFQEPPVSVITQVAFDPEVNYPVLLFSNPRPNPNKGQHIMRWEEAKGMLEKEPEQEIEFEEPKKAPARKKAPVRRGAKR